MNLFIKSAIFIPWNIYFQDKFRKIYNNNTNIIPVNQRGMV
jgi:hypothetical protein